MSTITNAVVARYVHDFNSGMWEFINNAYSVRDAAQKLISFATMAKVEDTENEVGCSLLSEFIIRVGDTRALPISVVRDYMVWLFQPGAIELAIDNGAEKPVINSAASSIRWNAEKRKFSPNKIVDEEGKRQAIPMDAMSVKARLAAYKWWEFNPARPKAEYKGKLISALKADIKAMNNGRYVPKDEVMVKFLKAVNKLADEYNID